METPEDNSELDKYANERLEKDIQDLLEEKKLKILDPLTTFLNHMDKKEMMIKDLIEWNRI